VLKQFRGVVAPPGMSAEVVNYYVELLSRTRSTDQWKQYVKQNELVEQWIAGPELAAFIESEEQVYQRITKEIAARKKRK
jgi:putative tricarboxylic transport membrane protein